MKQRLITLANALAVFAALLLLWQFVLWIFHVPPYMLPSPLAVALAGGDAASCARGEAAIGQAFAAHAGPDGVALPGACWLVRAHNE